MAQYCDDGRYKITRIGPWGGLDHYAPKPGKVLFAWEFDPNRPMLNRDKWGFTGVVVPASLTDQACDVFPPSSVIVAIHADPIWQDRVLNALSRNATTFFIDEPITLQREQQVRDSSPFISSRGGTLRISDWDSQYTTLCFASQWVRHASLRGLAMEQSPQLHLGANESFEDPPKSPCGVDDPRNGWTWLKQNCASLYDFSWIKTRESPDRMELLFGHANNLGLSTLWIWSEEANGLPDRRIDILCDRAWRSGWLRRFDKVVQQTWCCPTQSWDPEECELESSTLTGYIQEV